ncbi:flocculation protein FLO11-like [Homarus americanus]|uniref:flocculation protein FLO11-like n=1 Tax=Homarus americanus TaxID=6706 RepID=UPI001C46C7E3|nr:flocculation protein FLO11-like [Homarus americanus]
MASSTVPSTIVLLLTTIVLATTTIGTDLPTTSTTSTTTTTIIAEPPTNTTEPPNTISTTSPAHDHIAVITLAVVVGLLVVIILCGGYRFWQERRTVLAHQHVQDKLVANKKVAVSMTHSNSEGNRMRQEPSQINNLNSITFSFDSRSQTWSPDSLSGFNRASKSPPPLAPSPYLLHPGTTTHNWSSRNLGRTLIDEDPYDELPSRGAPIPFVPSYTVRDEHPPVTSNITDQTVQDTNDLCEELSLEHSPLSLPQLVTVTLQECVEDDHGVCHKERDSRLNPSACKYGAKNPGNLPTHKRLTVTNVLAAAMLEMKSKNLFTQKRDLLMGETGFIARKMSVKTKLPASRTTSLDKEAPVSRTTSLDKEAPVPRTTSLDKEAPVSRTTSLDKEAPVSRTTSLDKEAPVSRTTSLDKEAPVPRTTSLDKEAPVPRTTSLDKEAPVSRTTSLDKEAPVSRTTSLDKEAPVPRTTSLDKEAPVSRTTSLDKEAPVSRTTSLDKEAPVPRTTSLDKEAPLLAETSEDSTSESSDYESEDSESYSVRSGSSSDHLSDDTHSE